tara:strand:+ start:70819 stop:71043 length:225 start_codon:yes stop_codon:yes gene_type:complete
MEERKAPDPSERTEQREIDPSAYSLSSSAKMIDESFEETNEIQSWTGGNTDFSNLDDEPISVQKTDNKPHNDEN